MIRLPDRIAEKIVVDPGSACWWWTAAQSSGYGKVGWKGKVVRAHRLTYELLVGPIPDGLGIDHLCRNTACVNPAHLEPVTQRENLLRGETIVHRHALRTHCIRGHELIGDSIRRTPKGYRICIPCKRIHNRDYRARRRLRGQG